VLFFEVPKGKFRSRPSDIRLGRKRALCQFSGRFLPGLEKTRPDSSEGGGLLLGHGLMKSGIGWNEWP
jgi:hypothetical protein